MKYPSIFESGWFVFSIVLTFIIEVGIILYFYIAYKAFKRNEIKSYRQNYISNEECRKRIIKRKRECIVAAITTLPTLIVNFSICLYLIVFGLGFFKKK